MIIHAYDSFDKKITPHTKALNKLFRNTYLCYPNTEKNFYWYLTHLNYL